MQLLHDDQNGTEGLNEGAKPSAPRAPKLCVDFTLERRGAGCGERRSAQGVRSQGQAWQVNPCCLPWRLDRQTRDRPQPRMPGARTKTQPTP